MLIISAITHSVASSWFFFSKHTPYLTAATTSLPTASTTPRIYTNRYDITRFISVSLRFHGNTCWHSVSSVLETVSSQGRQCNSILCFNTKQIRVVKEGGKGMKVLKERNEDAVGWRQESDTSPLKFDVTSPPAYNQPTACCSVFPEKLAVAQLVKQFPAFYGTRRFNTVTPLTRVRQLLVSWARSTHFMLPPPPQTIFWISILIFTVVPCILIISKFFYLPTDAQENRFKKNIKIRI